MEIIKSLRKEEKRRSLSKLRLDINKESSKNMDSIIKYMSKDIKDMDLANVHPSEYLRFNNFQISIDELDDAKAVDLITRKYKATVQKVYQIIIEKADDILILYTVPSAKIPDSTRKYTFSPSFNTSHIKILDIHYIYGMLKTIDIVCEEIKDKEQFYLSEEFSKASIFGNSYTTITAEDILNLPFLSNGSMLPTKKATYENFIRPIALTVDTIAVMQNVDINVELANKYTKETNSDCARAFETKKNIPRNVLDIMNSTTLLKDFSYVEIDEESDLSKYSSIEREWNLVRDLLSLDKYLKDTKPELRFRKLGKHKALGLYYPTLKCMCIDTSSIASFMHEFGHFIDYTAGETQLSSTLDFYPIIKNYKESYNRFIENNPNHESTDYLKRKKSYYQTPTEIFARCLEIYLVNKGVKTSFLKENLEIGYGYVKVDDYFMDLINDYYSKLVLITSEKLKILNDRLENIA